MTTLMKAVGLCAWISLAALAKADEAPQPTPAHDDDQEILRMAAELESLQRKLVNKLQARSQAPRKAGSADIFVQMMKRFPQSIGSYSETLLVTHLDEEFRFDSKEQKREVFRLALRRATESSPILGAGYGFLIDYPADLQKAVVRTLDDDRLSLAEVLKDIDKAAFRSKLAAAYFLED